MDLQKVVGVVSLCGHVACVSDESADHRFVQAMRASRRGDDVLLHHHRTHVVGTPEQAHLSDVRPHGHPARADRIDVVQKQPAECLGSEIGTCPGDTSSSTELRVVGAFALSVETGHRISREWQREVVIRTETPLLDPAQRGVRGLKRPGDECHVLATALTGEIVDRIILAFSDEVHVMDPVRDAFDVPEHHRGRCVHAQFMGDTHDGEPCFRIAFPQSDLSSDLIREDLTAASRHRLKSRGVESFHHPADLVLEGRSRRIEEVDELDEFRWAERMDVDLRESFLDGGQEFDVPVEIERRIHAALHQDLGPTDPHEFRDLFEQHLMLQRVGILLVAFSLEGTEDAFRGADVGVVDVAVDDVRSDMVTVEDLASSVGQQTEPLWITAVVEVQCLFGGEAGRTGHHVLEQAGVQSVELCVNRWCHRCL